MFFRNLLFWDFQNFTTFTLMSGSFFCFSVAQWFSALPADMFGLTGQSEGELPPHFLPFPTFFFSAVFCSAVVFFSLLGRLNSLPFVPYQHRGTSGSCFLIGPGWKQLFWSWISFTVFGFYSFSPKRIQFILKIKMFYVPKVVFTRRLICTQVPMVLHSAHTFNSKRINTQSNWK